MATTRLRNITSGMAKSGALVRVHPTNKNAFQYVTDLTTLGVIGTIANAASPGGLCTINLINETANQPPEIIISDTAPVNPKINQLWIDTSEQY